MTLRGTATVGGAAGTLLVLSFAPLFLSKSRLYSLAEVLIFAVFAISLNILFGYLGLLSFGHSAYFGLGAYTTALLLRDVEGMPFAAALAAGVVVAALGGLAIGNFCVRLSGPYFAMLTLAFGQLLFVIAWQWRAVTRGDDGFGGFLKDASYLPAAARAGDVRSLYYLILGVTVPVIAVIWALMTRTPFGNLVVSIRENEERAQFLGYGVFAVKLATYTLSAGLAGLAGCLSVVQHNFVSTSSIDLNLSTDVVVMTFIGGTKFFLGPAVGAAFFVYFGDFISAVTERWQIIMGVIFIAMVLYAPGGFVGLVRVISALKSRTRGREVAR